MLEAGLVLFGSTFTVAACLAAGKLLFSALGLNFHRLEEEFFAFVTGSACLSLLVFATAAAGVAYPAVFAGIGTAIISLACLRGALRLSEKLLPPLERFWKAVFWVLFAVFGLLYFFHAMAPDISPDGTSHHLGFVRFYLLRHGFANTPAGIYASFSQGMEMLFLFAYAFGRQSAATLVHFTFLMALPLGVLCYGRRFGFPAAGAAGGLLVLASPVFGVDGISAYVDVALACAVFTVFYLLRIWATEGGLRMLPPIGLVAGFCYALKYTAFLAVPYALAVIGWNLRRDRRRCAAAVGVAACCALLVMGPWMAKNWILAGNPFSPFFNRIFPNPLVNVAFEDSLLRWYTIQTSGLAGRWQIPWEATTGGNLGGLLGPVFLLAPLALFALRRAEGRRLLAAGILFAIPNLIAITTRYVMPAIPFIALAMALALPARTPVLAALVILHAVLSWPSVCGRYASQYAWRLPGTVPVRAALRLESQDDYLNRRFPEYAVARMVQRLVPPGGRVFAYVPLPQAYTDREIVVQWTSTANKQLCDVLWTPLSRELEPAWQWCFNVPAQSARGIRLVQTATGRDVWSVSELRVFHAGRELPRTPRWRLRAHPNPWGVQAAFDNTEITRWSSGQPLFDGMFLEIDFGENIIMDSVTVQSTSDQDAARLRLDARPPEGGWRTLTANAARKETRPWSGRRLRGAVAGPFKAAGIEYLLIRDGEWGADDFRAHADEWRLEPLGALRGARLYRFR